VVKILTNQQTNKLIVAIELEPEVVAVAQKYFGITHSEKLKIVTMDAEQFMQRNIEQFDLVVVDLYSGDGVPMFVESEKFLRSIARALTSPGTVLINYASHSFGKEDFEKFETKLRKVFAHVQKKVIWGRTFYVLS
jgi:spermidine synthase